MSTDSAGPRLRSACTHCHAAKVKCSGEKTGCARCQSLGISCHFEVSLVGKCSKARRRKRSRVEPNLDPLSTAPKLGSGRTIVLHHGRDDSASSSTSSSVSAPKTTSLVDWTGRGSYDAFTLSSPEIDAGGLHHDKTLADSAFCNDIDTFLSSSLDDRLPMLPMDVRLPMLSMDGQVNHRPTLVSSSGTSDENVTEASLPNSSLVSDTAGPEQHRSMSKGPSAYADKPIDNRSLQVCFCSIASLEGQLKQGSKSVDEVMHTNKTCAQELRSAMGLDSYRRSTSGPMLVLTAVELMTLLYESSIPKVGLSADLAFPTLARFGSSTNTESSYPSLLLGNFKADPEEAAIIWKHVLLGELRRVLRLIDMLSVYRQDTQCRPNGPRATSSYRSLCDDLEQRIKSLITDVEA